MEPFLLCMAMMFGPLDKKADGCLADYLKADPVTAYVDARLGPDTSESILGIQKILADHDRQARLVQRNGYLVVEWEVLNPIPSHVRRIIRKIAGLESVKLVSLIPSP